MKNSKMKLSLRAKLVSAMFFTLAFVGIVTLSLVAWIQYQTSQTNISALERHIHDSIVSKGKVLIENHSLALKGMALDNAFGAVTNLVNRTVDEDRDVVYGLFLDSEKMPWAFSSPLSKKGDNKKEKSRDPKNDQWKLLNLKKENLDIKKISTRDVRLFSTEIYEVAMPVIDEDEVLGTIRYGLSLERIKTELSKTHKESEASLKKTLYQLGGVVLSITLFGILIASRVASRIVEPLRNLTQAANTIASGDRKVTVDIKSGDEIELLGDSFNQMVSDLNASYASLEDMNKNLEAKVLERTAELSTRNRDMRMVMENVTQGFITIRKDGTMSMEHSAIVNEWFDPYGENTLFSDFVGKVDSNFAEWFDLAWEDLLADIMPVELVLDQMPASLEARGRNLQFTFSAIVDEQEKVVGLLVVIGDITEHLEYERKEAEQREILAVFKRVTRDKSGYLAFESDARKLVDAICADDAATDLSLLKRQIHTLKGNSALFGISSVAEICHRVEDEMVESGQAPTREQLDRIRSTFARLQENTRMFTTGAEHMIEILTEDYTQLLRDLEAGVPPKQIVSDVRRWLLEPTSHQFDRIEEQAKALAARLGKGDIRVVKMDNDVRLNPERWGEFWASLSHVIRNAIDHGLSDKGDTEHEKVITLSSVSDSGKLTIAVGDNGRGIDWEVVRAKAEKMNLPNATREDLVAVLLSDGFTTQNTASETSGRGVGMAAVHQSVAQLHGNVFVESERDKGTTWRFEFQQDYASN